MRGFRTTARRWVWGAVIVAAVSATGCQSSPRRLAATEPGLTEPGTTVVSAAPPVGTQVSWMDRHPLFTKPKEYYDSSGNNKVVKTAAATVIGIPAGLFGEIKQIVVGPPPQPKF